VTEQMRASARRINDPFDSGIDGTGGRATDSL
jgi:hypothetical protein